MNHPVPVSRNGGGFTVVSPLPQSSVTSAVTSALTSTTAGVARSMASGTVIGGSAEKAGTACASTSASATRCVNRSIIWDTSFYTITTSRRRGRAMSRQIGEIPTRTFNTGDVIFREGDDAKGEAFLIHLGSV